MIVIDRAIPSYDSRGKSEERRAKSEEQLDVRESIASLVVVIISHRRSQLKPTPTRRVYSHQ